MSTHFEEIDRRITPLGEISVRRRLEPTLLVDVYEVKLGDEFLMSSLFTVAEVALATLALAQLPGDHLDVVVAGLGLGYTASAAAADPRVQSLHVVEMLDAVIEWHEQQLLPLSAELIANPRCHLVQGDFFAMIARASRFSSEIPDPCHAVLVDIDHSPRHHLHPSHAAFYTGEGLQRVADHLRPGGVFAMWSDDAPDVDFIAALEDVFVSCAAHVVTFPNFYTGAESSSTVYVAQQREASAADQ
ncbi:MAG: spermidine synthase [Acidimicrobiia bacterium]|nr:spermidine synthase [Acidimicrobiia bacterium]